MGAFTDFKVRRVTSRIVSGIKRVWKKKRSLSAEDLQHKSLSGSVSHDRGQHEESTDDNGKGFPESREKKTQDDENAATNSSEDSLTSSDVRCNGHIFLLINPS